MNSLKDIEKKDRHEMVSRRDFMKYTGTIIFVIGSGQYLYAGKNSANLTNRMRRESGSYRPMGIFWLIPGSARVV